MCVHPEKQQHVSQHAHCLKTGWLPGNGKEASNTPLEMPPCIGSFALMNTRYFLNLYNYVVAKILSNIHITEFGMQCSQKSEFS